jgi:hypothetical protein
MNSNYSLETGINLNFLKGFFDKYNSGNMYSSTFLIIFGIFGNLITFSVLFYARKRLPRINSIKSLMFFTLTNIVQLAIHFYSNTLSRIIYHFDLNDSILVYIHFYDTNKYVCKIFVYLKFLTRFLNLTIIVFFSFERLLAIYFPFRSVERNKNYILTLFVVASFIYPIYALFMCETVEISSDRTNYNSSFNTTKDMNLGTMTPIFGKTYCSILNTNEKLFFKFQSGSYFIIIFAYLFVSLSIILIVCKLKKKEKIIFYYNSRLNKNNHTNKEKINLRKLSKHIYSTNQYYNRSSTRINNQLSLCVNQKFHNTKMLITLSASLIVFNFPFFFVLFVIFLNMKTFNVQSEKELLYSIQMKSYFTVVEVIQLINISISGLLLFISGKIFRFHFLSWMNKTFKLKSSKKQIKHLIENDF